MLPGKKVVKPVQSARKGSSKEGEPLQQEYKKKYIEIEQIGRGVSGTVYLVKQKLDRKFYIAKKIILTNLDTTERQAVEQELQLMKKLQHPHVVRYIDSFQDAQYLAIIMEYCEQGDLSFHIRQKQKEGGFFSEKVIMNWFIQLTMALDFVHNNHVLHRDIKCSNVFLTSNGSIKLGDFGVSKVLRSSTDNAHTLIGTPYYLSPEVCENKPYTFQSDIWALGCVLFEICSLRHPFSCDSLIQLVVKIINEPNPKIPSSYSEELQCLVQILLAKRPEQRPNTQQIFSFPFIVDTMKDFVSSKGLKSELKGLPIKKTQLHIEKEKKRMEDKKLKQNQVVVAGKASKGASTPISANKKTPVQASHQVEQIKQSVTPNSKPQRKNSKDIRRMEDLIQKQMSEVKNDVQKKMIEVRAIKKPITQPIAQQEKHIQQKTNQIIETKPILKQKVSGEVSPAIQQGKLVQKQQTNPPKNDKAITPQQSNYDKKIEEMMSNLQSKVKQEYELIKKESPKKSQVKSQIKDNSIINLEKSKDSPNAGQPLKQKVEEQNSNSISTKQFQNKAESSMMQDSNVSFNLSLTNNSVFNQTAFKKGINMKLATSQPKIEGIIEENIQEIQDPNKKKETEEELKEEIEYKNEFIEDNNEDDMIKYQTAISENIQTQQLTIKEKEITEQICQKQENNANEDSFDIESLPQREDYIESDEGEQYQEDFTVSSEEGEQDSTGSEKPQDFRLTRKNMDKELEEVLDMYKSQLGTSAPQEFDKFKHMLNMSEIVEVSGEYSTGELSKKLGNKNGQLEVLKQS